MPPAEENGQRRNKEHKVSFTIQIESGHLGYIQEIFTDNFLGTGLLSQETISEDNISEEPEQAWRSLRRNLVEGLGGVVFISHLRWF